MTAQPNEHRHLLVVAHGSRSAAWCDAVRRFVGSMAAAIASGGRFHSVSGAFLENASPSIDEALSALCGRSSIDITALPLFMVRSGHLRDDVPVEIGGRARLIPPCSPVSWLPGNVLRRLAHSGARLDTSGVVLVAYGSDPYRALWDTMLQATCNALRALGVGAASFAYVGHLVGMSPEPTLAALAGMAQADEPGVLEALHVVPVLFGSGALQRGPIAAACERAREVLVPSICYTADAILPDAELAPILVEYASRLTPN